MNAAGVARAVLVSPSMEGERNDLVLEAARLHPDRFAAMGRIAVEQPENKTVIPALMQEQGMMGLRLTFFVDQHGYLSESVGKADWWLWAEAERAGVPLMVAAHGDLLAGLPKIAERYSALTLAIDHMAAGISQERRRGIRLFTPAPAASEMAEYLG